MASRNVHRQVSWMLSYLYFLLAKAKSEVDDRWPRMEVQILMIPADS